jgi:triosephosphate isomerase
MIVFIKNLLYSTFNLSVSKVLYGGSVTAKNAKGFLSQKEIDGALVGGASLRPLEFRQIISSI